MNPTPYFYRRSRGVGERDETDSRRRGGGKGQTRYVLSKGGSADRDKKGPFRTQQRGEENGRLWGRREAVTTSNEEKGASCWGGPAANWDGGAPSGKLRTKAGLLRKKNSGCTWAGGTCCGDTTWRRKKGNFSGKGKRRAFDGRYMSTKRGLRDSRDRQKGPTYGGEKRSNQGKNAPTPVGSRSLEKRRGSKKGRRAGLWGGRATSAPEKSPCPSS